MNKPFREYAHTVTDFQSAQHLIRYNNVSDTGDVCSAISPRCDLLSEGKIRLKIFV